MIGLNERTDSLKRKDRGLSPREKLFCLNFCNCADAKQSAINAGYKKNPKCQGEQLLCRSDVADEIMRLSKTRERSISIASRVFAERLAFGSIADAVSLLYMDSPTKEQLRNMDLYPVSEIKKLKDGAMEIKFFDRLKSLEKLATESENENESCNSLIEALNKGAQNLNKCTGEECEL